MTPPWLLFASRAKVYSGKGIIQSIPSSEHEGRLPLLFFASTFTYTGEIVLVYGHGKNNATYSRILYFDLYQIVNLPLFLDLPWYLRTRRQQLVSSIIDYHSSSVFFYLIVFKYSLILSDKMKSIFFVTFCWKNTIKSCKKKSNVIIHKKIKIIQRIWEN